MNTSMKHLRKCFECGKEFHAMTNKQWNWNFAIHRLGSNRHKSFRTPEYIERVKTEYKASKNIGNTTLA